MDLLAWAALLSLAADCGPVVHPATTAAIIQVESQGNPLAIADNTRRASYIPHTQAEAVRLASQLHQQGHSLDIGVRRTLQNRFRQFPVFPHSSASLPIELLAKQLG